MLLTVDIGNTNISFGLFENNKLKKSFNIPTKKYNLAKLLNKTRSIKVNSCVICAVVPRMQEKLRQAIKHSLKITPYIIGKDIRVPLKNLYRKPEQVGQDRLVNAYAALKLYGAPAIVIDYGTAVTFDVISVKKEYLGGMILPGLNMSLEALGQKTALLPKVKLKKPAGFIGRDTKNSILGGIVWGYAALSNDLVKKIKLKIGPSAKVIATGGDALLLSAYCRCFDCLDKELTLKGLMYIHKDNNYLEK